MLGLKHCVVSPRLHGPKQEELNEIILELVLSYSIINQLTYSHPSIPILYYLEPLIFACSLFQIPKPYGSNYRYILSTYTVLQIRIDPVDGP